MRNAIYRPVKFTDALTDAWYLRTKFIGNVDCIDAYKFWNLNRNVRVQTHINFIVKI